MKGRRVDEYGVGRPDQTRTPGVSESSVGRSKWFKFFDRSQGLVASRIAGWALVVFFARCHWHHHHHQRENGRSGQAGLLVPKAATTARGSLKAPQAFRLPFRHL